VSCRDDTTNNHEQKKNYRCDTRKHSCAFHRFFFAGANIIISSIMATELRQRRRTTTSTGESTGTDDFPRGVGSTEEGDEIFAEALRRRQATTTTGSAKNEELVVPDEETEKAVAERVPSRLLLVPQDPDVPSSASSLLSTTSATTPHLPLAHQHYQHRRRHSSSASSISTSESKWSKISRRGLSGFLMFAVFASSVSAGHIYICLLVAVIESLLFRELVRVRYNAYFSRIENTIPLFRTTQWMWFAVAIFYTYGDFVSDVVQSNQSLHYLLKYTQYWPSVSFFLYSSTFVLSIVTLQRDHIRFQINQLCWTILVRCQDIIPA
jgi:Cytidylyltransferase family